MPRTLYFHPLSSMRRFRYRWLTARPDSKSSRRIDPSGPGKLRTTNSSRLTRVASARSGQRLPLHC